MIGFNAQAGLHTVRVGVNVLQCRLHSAKGFDGHYTGHLHCMKCLEHATCSTRFNRPVGRPALSVWPDTGATTVHENGCRLVQAWYIHHGSDHRTTTTKV